MWRRKRKKERKKEKKETLNEVCLPRKIPKIERDTHTNNKRKKKKKRVQLIAKGFLDRRRRRRGEEKEITNKKRWLGRGMNGGSGSGEINALNSC